MKYKINRKVSINGVCHTIHAQTEQEYADRIIAMSCSGDCCEAGCHSFGEYAAQWFNTYCKPNVETVTANTYKRQLDKYLLPWFGEINIEELTTDRIQELFNSMQTAKATKDKVKIVLNQILGAALDDGIITKNPAKSKRLKVNGGASKETPPYSVDQMKHIVAHIGDVKNERDRLYIALQALHPLRLEEVLGLCWDDLDFDAGTISVKRAVTHPDRNKPIIKETKTEKSVRVVALSRTAARYLCSVAKRQGFVLGEETPLSYTQVRRMCERIQKDMDFEEKITPIRFRTTVLTDIYDQTKDLRLTQEAGGHTTPEMTLKHYVKGRECVARTAQAIDNLYAG